MRNYRNRLFYFWIIILLVMGLFFLKDNLNLSAPVNTKPFVQLNPETVEEIVIVSNQLQTRINKSGSNWLITVDGIKYPADNELINNILIAFSNLQKDNIVSTNKNHHQDFGIGSSKIVLKTSTKNYTLFIGSSADSTTNYLRINTEDEVFIGQGFSDLSSKTDFRNLKINLINNENQVNSLAINYDNQSLLLVKKNNAWSLNNQVVKAERVDYYINDIKTLRGKNMALRQKINLSGEPTLIINLTENKTTKTLTFYPGESDFYWLAIDKTDFVYEIPQVYVTSLKKVEKDFLE